VTNATRAPKVSADRPVKSKKPAYFAGFFAVFLAGFATCGFGGALNIFRKTSSSLIGAGSFLLGLVFMVEVSYEMQ